MANDKRFVVESGLQTQNIEYLSPDGLKNLVVSYSNTGTLSYIGSNGQLFAITDESSGSIFSVNDISGIPSIEVDLNGNIFLAESTGNVGIGTSTPAGKLSVNTGTTTSYTTTPGNVGVWDSTYSLFGNASSTTGAAIGIGMTSVGGIISSLQPGVAWKDLYFNANNYYWYNNTVNLLSLSTGSNLTVYGSMSSPIYYDQNNTAYYVDPASTSNLANLSIAVLTVADASSKLVIVPSGGQNYIESGNAGFTGNATLNITGYNGQVGSDLYLYYNNIHAQGIIYDGSNGSYYLKPSLQSVLSRLQLNSATTSVGPTTSQLNIITNSQGMIYFTDTSNNAKSSIRGDAGGNLVLNASTNNFYFNNDFGTNAINFLNVNTSFMTVSGTTVSLPGSLYTPIFYDLNNSAYYVDPASTSNLNGLTVASPITASIDVFDTRSTVTGPNLGNHEVRFDFLANSTDGLNDGGTYHGVMTFQQWTDASGGGTRQLGFTDNDNLWIRGSGSALTSYNAWKQILDSANYNNYSPTLTGTGASGTWNISITGNAATLGGYSSSYYQKATNISDTAPTGATSDLWWDSSTAALFIYYAGTWVETNPNLGISSQPQFSSLGIGVAASAVTGTINATTSVTAPIYYDYNNTGYYLDPASTSNINSIIAPRIFIDRSNNTNSGISWYASSYTAWADYMATATQTSVGPTGNITAPSGSIVTSWARRSFIENLTGYGWTFESGTSTGQPSVVAEIRSSDGAAFFHGALYAGGDVTAYYSDARLKDFKGKIKNPIKKINSINGYYFTENQLAKELGLSNDNLQIGVSAQEIEAVLPEIVVPAPFNNEYKTVKYDKLVPLLIEAIKELNDKVEKQDKLIKQLKHKPRKKLK